MSELGEPARLAEWLRPKIESDRDGALLGKGYQASVHVYATPFGRVVVKSAHPSALLGYFGQRAIRREYEIYERLKGIAGIPRSFGLIDDKYLVLEHVEGSSLRDSESSLEDRPRFFARLLGTLEQMHRAGVAHGDLKRKDNILVAPDERPYVIDFGIACLKRGPARWWNRLLFDWFRQADYNAWIKLKYHRKTDQLLPEDALHYRPLLVERIARGIRIPWQKLTLRRWRKRRQAQARNRGE